MVYVHLCPNIDIKMKHFREGERNENFQFLKKDVHAIALVMRVPISLPVYEYIKGCVLFALVSVKSNSIQKIVHHCKVN